MRRLSITRALGIVHEAEIRSQRIGIVHFGQAVSRIEVVVKRPQDCGRGRRGLPPGFGGDAVEVVVIPLG